MSIRKKLAVLGLAGPCLLFALLGTALSEPPAPSAAGGAAVYEQRCSSCHMELGQTSISGASADAIKTAIAKTKQMKALAHLTPADIQSVAAALAAKAPASATSAPASAPSAAPDGVALYQAHCASCHRPLAQSRVHGASASEIQRLIARKSQMKSLSGMTAAEVQAVADALSANPKAAATSSPASAPAVAAQDGGTRSPTAASGRNGPRREREDDD